MVGLKDVRRYVGGHFITIERGSPWWFLSLRMIGFDVYSVDENCYRPRRWTGMQGADSRTVMWVPVFFLDKMVLVTLTEGVHHTS